MNLGPMMPGMPGMAGAGFPTPFGRMTDGTNQGVDQMPPGMAEQMPTHMGGGGNMNFPAMMSNDKMVMAN